MYKTISILLFFVCVFSAFANDTTAVPTTPTTESQLIKLAHPSIAARLALTAEQQAEINKVLVERSQLLAKAAEADWTKIITENDQKLENILTPAQKTLFPTVLTAKTIRINFKLQGWADVLQWFADQSGLQLIMDAPPPGTCNYADQQDYTVDEALNILNGILQIRGYTLVRNDTMLMLFDLRKTKIPLQYLPKVKPEELQQRKTFEYVCAAFPLERRDQAAVIQAMVPFQGPFCSITPLPGNTLMIADTAGALQVLQTVIAGVPNPPPRPAQPATPKKVPPPPPMEFVVFFPKHISVTSAQTILQGVYTEANVTADAVSSKVVIKILPAQKPALQSLLEQLDAEDADREKMSLKAYEFDNSPSIAANGIPITPAMFLPALQALAPKAGLAFDNVTKKLLVWATDYDHKIIAEAVKDRNNIGGSGDGKKYGHFLLNRIRPENLSPILLRLHPEVSQAYDYQANMLIVDGPPKSIASIGELLKEIDSATVSDRDPVVRFYSLEKEPTPVLVSSLKQICPTAGIHPDAPAKQLMVIARPEDQKKIADNLKVIATAYQGPEEPMLCIYTTVSQNQRAKLIGFIRTAASQLKSVTIVPDRSPSINQESPPATEATIISKQIAIWATPTEHKVIVEVLEQIKQSANELPVQQLKVFPMSVGDISTARSILRVSHPDVSVFPDPVNNRLIVWGTPENVEKVAETLAVQGSIDNRQMLAYPVAGTDLKTIQKVIADVFTGLKITPEPQSNRILVWASPEEHTKIAEIVEQTNKKEDPDSELADKYVAYSVIGLNAVSIQQLFKTLFPETDVFAAPASDKFVVKARKREHQQIRLLLEQMRQDDDVPKMHLAVYHFGETDPVLIEALLHNRLPKAESLTSDILLNRYSSASYYARLQNSYYSVAGNTVKKEGYFKVDDKTQSVHVFASAEKQTEIAAAITTITDDIENSKPVVKHYVLNDVSFYDIDKHLAAIAPGAVIEPVYVYIPPPPATAVPGVVRAANFFSYREFSVYAMESDHKKIAALVKDINERSAAGRREITTLTLPDNSPYSQKQVISTIQKLYPDTAPMAGGTSKQILIWAAKHRSDIIKQTIEEACQPLPEGQQTVTKMYPLKWITAAEAREWLSAMFPNVSFDPERLASPAAASAVPWRGPARKDNSSVIHAVATPLEHAEIAKAITELDKEVPDAYKITPKIYTFADLSAASFHYLHIAVHYAFPGITAIPIQEQRVFTVVATDEIHQQVADFLKLYRENSQQTAPVLEIYELKRNNYFRVVPMMQRIAPSASVFSGVEPASIAVWGTPKEQSDIAQALAKLETASETNPQQNWKLYKVGTNKAETMQRLLNYQFPGAIILPTSPNELAVWSSPADHDGIATELKTVAEAFPEPTVATYYFKHVPLMEGAEFLRLAFTGRATLSPRLTTGDLLVYALPEVQQEIAKNVKEFDQPRPRDAEPLPVAYDLSDIPAAWLPQTVQSLQRVLGTGVLINPSPGQVVIWAKPPEQEKARMFISEMLRENRTAAETLQTYTLDKGTVYTLYGIIMALVPNVQLAVGTTPNQLVVRGKDSDHAKVREFLDGLEKADADLRWTMYSLKNVYSYGLYGGPIRMLQTLVSEQGLDAKIYYDQYTKQLGVQARPAIHKMVAELLEQFRQPERDLAIFTLENIDPVIASRAIYTLFEDEPYSSTPNIEIDQNTNMIFVLGTKEQLEKVRQKLVDMGEPATLKVSGDVPAAVPVQPPTVPVPSKPSNLRVLQFRGNAADSLRELEKLWKQSQPNRLQVLKDGETPDGAFSVADEVERNGETTVSPLTPLAANVYLVLNNDGTMTAASQDTSALDQLELLVERIESGIVFEGRDYTIFSVRNISADVVALKLRFILQQRLAPQQTALYQRQMVPLSALTITPDITSNIIYVRGAKRERQEVAKLIAMLDVSELPGERMALRPVKVPIKNTQVSRVYMQVLNVYQSKMSMTRLPGGQYPRILLDNLTNSLEIIAPEPLLTELKEYAEDIDRRMVEEPGRKIHVIPLNVKSSVVQQAIQQIQKSSGGR